VIAFVTLGFDAPSGIVNANSPWLAKCCGVSPMPNLVGETCHPASNSFTAFDPSVERRASEPRYRFELYLDRTSEVGKIGGLAPIPRKRSSSVIRQTLVTLWLPAARSTRTVGRLL
jgi:hypothetical protein